MSELGDNRSEPESVPAPALAQGDGTEPYAASLRQCISDAVHDGWHALVELLDADHCQVGQILFSGGMIAWAVCRNQSETLGTFLHRLGRITPEDLRRVREIYCRNGGAKKLGAILQEEGLMQEPVLRRCLMLHTRRALALLLARDDLWGRVIPVHLPQDERFVFYPEEVLPLSVSTEVFKEALEYQSQAERWSRLGKDNAVLRQLVEITDYRASAICSRFGEVITAHLDPTQIDPYVLSVLLAGMVESSSRATQQGRIGMIQTITIECSEGCLVAKWIDDNEEYLAVVLVATAGNAGAAKVKLRRCLSALRDWVCSRIQEP